MRVLPFLVLSSLLVACGGAPPPPPEEAPKKTSPGAKREKVPEMKAEIGALDERAVNKTFEKLMHKVESCQDERRKAPKLDFVAGDVGLEVRVNEEGRAREVFLTRTTLGDRALERCIVEAAKSIEWPKPVGGREGIAKNGFALPMKGERDAVTWDAAKVGSQAKSLAKCTAGKKGPFEVTAYVDESGKVIAAGATSPNGEGANAAADCLAEAASKMKLPSPGGWPAKVTFPVD